MMPYPKPNFPTSVWNGLSNNIDRIDTNSNVDPNAEDWERIASEVIAMQENITPSFFSVTDSSILGVNYSVILVDATSGEVTLTLPTVATSVGVKLDVKKIDSTENNVIIDGSGSETIDGVTTQTLSSQYENLTIVSNGTEWFIL